MRNFYNKIKFSIASFFVLFAAMFLYGPISRLWRFLFERKYQEMPADLPWTPDHIMEFFRTCKWTSDPLDGMVDIISKPEKFFMTQCGDCDEFSIFAANIIDKRSKYIMSVIWWDPKGKAFRKFQGHNVCIYKVGLQWYHISNWGAFGPFSTLMPITAHFITPHDPMVPSIVPKGCQPIVFAIRHPETLSYVVGARINKLEPRK